MALSLVSVNVEWSRHLDTVLPFLEAHPVDVVCIQELVDKDIPVFEKLCGPCIGFGSNAFKIIDGNTHAFGNGIFSRLRGKSDTTYYVGSESERRLDDGASDVDVHSFVAANLEKEGVAYRLITTHFTWTKNGEATDLQLGHLENLLTALAPFGEFVLCGDFNAPRGRETFTRLAARYRDNIPSEYESSLDPVMHTKAGRHLPYMVDGLFTTPEYTANDVSLQFGVSDHAAIVASVEKAA